MIIDTHAHLYWENFKEDFDEMIKRALGVGVSIIINVGVDLEKSKEALRQVTEDLSKFSSLNAYSTIGIHPHEAPRFAQGKLSEEIKALEQIYQSNQEKVVAVGECGLDFLEVDDKTKDLQIKLFQAQIDLAKKLSLPLIVHCRDDRSKDPENSECWDKTLEMISDRPAILHCYSGLLKTTNQALKSPNLLFSFAGNITYAKNEYLREAIKIIPLDRIVIETDCPFLPPQVYRGKRNEPSFIVETAKTIAEIKSISPEELSSATTLNSSQIFKIKV